MYRLPAFKGTVRQRDYVIGGIFNGLTRMFAPFVTKVFLNLGKQGLERVV